MLPHSTQTSPRQGSLSRGHISHTHKTQTHAPAQKRFIVVVQPQCSTPNVRGGEDGLTDLSRRRARPEELLWFKVCLASPTSPRKSVNRRIKPTETREPRVGCAGVSWRGWSLTSNANDSQENAGNGRESTPVPCTDNNWTRDARERERYG